MNYFNDVFPTILELECVSCIAVYAGSESSLISLKISLFVFQRGMKVLRVWNHTRVTK